MNETQELLTRLQDADATAEALEISRPELAKVVSPIRLQLAEAIEALEALEAVR